MVGPPQRTSLSMHTQLGSLCWPPSAFSHPSFNVTPALSQHLLPFLGIVPPLPARYACQKESANKLVILGQD